MSRSRLIVNPSSGKDRGPEYLPEINRALRERFGMMEIVMTTGSRDGEAAAEQAVADGCDRVFVAGGDGTLNEVVNGVMRAGALDRVTIGLLPLGTGNDFARMLHLSEEPGEAVAALAEGREVRVDVGTLNGRAFINASGGGFISEVSEAVDDRLKSIAGKLAFLIGGAQVVLDYEPVPVRIEVDDQPPFDATPHMFAVCNARQIGGGRLIAPHAEIDDGLLDVCLVDAMPVLDFVSLLRRVADGSHLDDERVHYFRARAMTMTFARPVKVNTDGELLEAAECVYRVLPGAATFLAGVDTSNS
jgi:diacylglycerol kinase (ATP)